MPRTPMFTGFSSQSRTLCVPCSCRTVWFGSCVRRYTSMPTCGRWTIKQESMMNKNSRSNQSIVKVKPQPGLTRPPQSCALCQRMAYTSHGRTQRYASCTRAWDRSSETRKEGSNSTVVTRILHAMNPCWQSTARAKSYADHQSGSAYRHCECPHFPDYATSACL